MTAKEKKTADKPYAKGGGGFSYEHTVQAYLTVLMLTKTPFHFLPPWRIEEIQFQTEWRGHNTDDLAVIFLNPNSDDAEKRKALVEIKSSISCTERNPDFVSVIQNAWDDFDNSKIFEKEKDVIVLITGLLNAGDHKSFARFIGNVKYTKNYEEFCEKKKSFSKAALKKHEAVKAILIAHIENPKKNKGEAESKKPLDEKAKEELDKKIYDFYCHFFIHQLEFGDEKGLGPMDGLVLSIISDYQQEKPQQLWARVMMAMKSWNKNSGTIAKSCGPIGFRSLPDDIKEDFSQKIFYDRSLVSHVGAQIKKLQAESAIFLARAALIGSWSDQNEHDQAMVAKSLKKDGNYAACGEEAQKISSLPLGNMLLVYKGNAWRVKNRDEIMQSVGKHFIDSEIDVFKDCVISVLDEKDPAWDLPPEQRYMAGVCGVTPKYSKELRHGLVEGLAILANNSDSLERCQLDIGKDVAEYVVWKIFSNAGADVWGSMNDLLPTFAEAAPEQFLKMVREALNQNPCPFDELFAYEGDGITSKSYWTGILEAMGCLAQNKKCFVETCAELGKMAYRESGSQRENRPFNLLINILLPSMVIPKPRHSWEQRKSAAISLLRKFPDVALELFLGLLPKERIVFSTKKLKIRTVSEERVLRKQYTEEVRFYSELIVELVAENDVSRLTMIADNLTYLPAYLFRQLVETLKSSFVASLSEDKRYLLWQKLMKFVSNHWRSDASKQKVALVKKIAKKLAPKSDFYICQWLFCLDEGCVVYGEEDGQWKRLPKRRDVAIRNLFNKGGVESVIRFFNKAECNPYIVGHALGFIDDKSIDQKIFPDFLENSDGALDRFSDGIVIRKIKDVDSGWQWFDGIDKSKSEWTPAKIGCLLAYFPLSQKTGAQVSELLGENDGEYWSRVGKKTYLSPLPDAEYLHHAMEKIIKYGNSPVAIQLLGNMLHDKRRPDVGQCVRALLSLSRARVKFGETLKHYIKGVVNFLQSSDVSVDKNDIIKVEWDFLGVGGIVPKYLEKEMACCAEFFCEIVRLAYPLKEDEKKQSQNDYMLAGGSHKPKKILDNWRKIPGFNGTDVMDSEFFKSWILDVKENCKKDSYRKISLDYIGGVLTHLPENSDGLWINRAVAEILDEDSNDTEIMREGFNRGIINSRGVHWVDPTGEPERKLAEKWEDRANQLDRAGFSLFAASVRELASRYERERKQVIDSEKNRND